MSIGFVYQLPGLGYGQRCLEDSKRSKEAAVG